MRRARFIILLLAGGFALGVLRASAQEGQGFFVNMFPAVATATATATATSTATSTATATATATSTATPTPTAGATPGATLMPATVSGAGMGFIGNAGVLGYSATGFAQPGLIN